MLESLIGHDFVSLSWMHPYLASPLEGDLFYADFFQRAFEKYHSHRKLLPSEETIPKILHFIWIGERPFPEKSIKNLQSWKKFHPEWKMIFWTDRHECPIIGMEKKTIEITKALSILFHEASNPSERSDYLRFDILNRMGGIYIDHDVQCLASFEEIILSSSFFCMQNTFRFSAPFTYRFQEKTVECRFSMATAVIGSKPNHPLWLSVFSAANENWQYYTDQWSHFEAVRTMHRSFLPLSLGIIEYLHHSEDPTVCVLPKICLYPHHFNTSLFKNLRKKWTLCKNKDNNTWISKTDLIQFKKTWQSSCPKVNKT